MGLRIIGCLDGIVFALIAQVLIVVVPGFGRDALGAPHLLSVAPAVALAWFAWRLPVALDERPAWAGAVARLRAFALSLAALLPFAVWLFSAPESWYLFWNTVLALAAAVGFFFNLTLVLRELAVVGDREELAVEAVWLRQIVIFTLLAPLAVALAGVLFLRLDRGLSPGHAVGMLLALTQHFVSLIALLVFLPISLCITLGIRVRLALAAAVHSGSVAP